MPAASKTPPELILIRHAETEWNASGRWQGHSDPPLSERGREQAARLARELASAPPDRLEASDLLRARQTAAALLEYWDVPVRSDPIYRELDLGDWSGLTREQIRQRDPEILAPFDQRIASVRAPGGECRTDLWRRVEQALVALCARCAGETVAIVTHGGVVLALFPEAEVRNATAHRGRADELLALLRERLRGVAAAGDDSGVF